MADLALEWGRPLSEVRDLTMTEWNMMVEALNRRRKRQGGKG